MSVAAGASKESCAIGRSKKWKVIKKNGQEKWCGICRWFVCVILAGRQESSAGSVERR